MKIRHALVASAVLISSAALAAPAAQAGTSGESTSFTGFSSLQAGGPWAEGTVTVANTSAVEDTTNHLVLTLGADQLALDQVAMQYADGPADSWKPLALSAADSGSVQYAGGTVDLTGAPLDLKPGASHTFRLRIQLPQTAQQEIDQDLQLRGVLAPDLASARTSSTAAGYLNLKVGGLGVQVVGLPAPIPADGRAHPFQVRITTANGFDWHLDRASFFVWAGQGVGQMSGPSACDAEIDVQDPATKAWHKVGMQAAGFDGNDVDLVKWATGPVSDRVVNARISVGKNFKVNTADSTLGFGYYPGEGPNYFWASQKLAVAPAADALDCVNPDAPAPGASAAPVAATTPAAASATPSAAHGSAKASAPATASHQASAAASGGGELASTGSSGTGTIAGLGAALLAAGAGVMLLMRRRGRRA
ncbi:hypothetical protein GCM10009665_44640 [Kitasatospora nipponensis]|uniref:LPXTG-motif cell wall-anchored protein n=1 Tax=Kitasatospora nipponensis TaxID=258049 RepID=A0ABP4H361_9ACTN